MPNKRKSKKMKTFCGSNFMTSSIMVIIYRIRGSCLSHAYRFPYKRYTKSGSVPGSSRSIHLKPLLASHEGSSAMRLSKPTITTAARLTVKRMKCLENERLSDCAVSTATRCGCCALKRSGSAEQT